LRDHNQNESQDATAYTNTIPMSVYFVAKEEISFTNNKKSPEIQGSIKLLYTILLKSIKTEYHHQNHRTHQALVELVGLEPAEELVVALPVVEV